MFRVANSGRSRLFKKFSKLSVQFYSFTLTLHYLIEAYETIGFTLANSDRDGSRDSGRVLIVRIFLGKGIRNGLDQALGYHFYQFAQGLL